MAFKKLVSAFAATALFAIAAPAGAQGTVQARAGVDVAQRPVPKTPQVNLSPLPKAGDPASCKPFPSEYSLSDIFGAKRRAAMEQWALCGRRWAGGIRATDIFALAGLDVPEFTQIQRLTVTPVSTGRVKLGFQVGFR